MCRSRHVLLLAVLGVYVLDVLCVAAADRAAGGRKKRTPDSVYVATPHDVVAKMLEVAGVTKDDVLYDPGCGDGRPGDTQNDGSLSVHDCTGGLRPPAEDLA